jgi:hypothetical protein
MKKEYEERISDECNVAIFAQVYLDQQRRKQKAVPVRLRDEHWRERQAHLDQVQRSVDRMLGILDRTTYDTAYEVAADVR